MTETTPTPKPEPATELERLANELASIRDDLDSLNQELQAHPKYEEGAIGDATDLVDCAHHLLTED